MKAKDGMQAQEITGGCSTPSEVDRRAAEVGVDAIAPDMSTGPAPECTVHLYGRSLRMDAAVKVAAVTSALLQPTLSVKETMFECHVGWEQTMDMLCTAVTSSPALLTL
jgi:hypothetical protein